MRVYWVDTGVLVQSRLRFFKKERNPEFWTWLDRKLAEGVIRMPKRVYDEVIKGNDWLVKFVKNRKELGLCVYPNAEVQAKYNLIAEHVEINYRDQWQKDRSLYGADLWAIAHAWDDQDGYVVSQEDPAKQGDNRVKIPNVCRELDPPVRCIDIFKMLDLLEVDNKWI